MPVVPFTVSNSASFYSQKLWGLIFLALEPWPGGPGMGWGPLTPKISLLNFYPPHVGVGPACFTSLCLLPVWMDVFCLVPYLSDFHLTRFLMVLSDDCSVVSLLFDVVVRGGEPYLPTPLSWPEILCKNFLVWCSPICLFFLLFLFSDIYQTKYCCKQCSRFYCLCFCLGFWWFWV